ncbi:MAG: hypothetical protein R3E98_05630 [Gemmatimonadota bacterium]
MDPAPGGAAVNRVGAVGLEWVVGVLLVLALAAVGFGALSLVQRTLLDGVRVSESATVLADVSRIVGDEIRAGVAARDWSVHGGDSVALRAFRGTAVVCASNGADLSVSYRGDRAVDTAKDSVLVLDGDARWAVAAVTRVTRAPGACGAAGDQRWRLDRVIAHASVGRVFERGAYTLAASSLRYRRGLGGRQPLTYARLDSAGTGFRPAGTGGVGVELVLAGVRGSAARQTRTLWPRSPRP